MVDATTTRTFMMIQLPDYERDKIVELLDEIDAEFHKSYAKDEKPRSIITTIKQMLGADNVEKADD